MATNYHTVTHNGQWAVMGEGNQEPTKVYPTQEEAWQETKRIARISKGEAVLHGQDGTIREKESF